ncbi:MAG: NlpC/P60 family protein [Gaiellales bacterium]
MASAARRIGVLLVVAAFAAAAAAGPANADRISQKKAEIAQVENELNAFNQQLDAAAEAYNRAQSELAQVQADIRENTRRLKLAKANLRIAKHHLAAFLVSSYKGDRTDVFEVLGSGSFTELLNRVEYVQRMSDAEGELLAQVQKAEHEIQVRQAKLKIDQKKAVRLVAETKQHKADAEAALAARQQMLGGLQSDLKQLIDQRQAHLDAVARQKAAALAAAQQQQAQAASSGSSSSSSSSSSGSTGTSGSGGGSWSPPPAGPLGSQAVAIAQRYLGVPYVWGGASPSGFDCSGLTMYVYAQLGIGLGHYTGSQYNAGPHVSMSQLAPGDLVFFYAGHDHVGIYMGGGLFIHAPHTGDVVKISSLSGYYAANFSGAVRVTG